MVAIVSAVSSAQGLRRNLLQLLSYSSRLRASLYFSVWDVVLRGYEYFVEFLEKVASVST